MAVIAVVSVRRDHRLLGYELENKATTAPTDTLTMAGDTLVVHTAMLAQDVQGYAGTTPLDIYVLDNVVVKIVALPNVESPDFFGEAVGLLDAYKGKTVDEALSAKVDGVSGATFSSRSLISNVRRGVAYASAHNASAADGALSWALKTIVALLVIVLGMTVPLVVRNKKMRLVQLVLDIVVLGLWTGTFVSYTMLVNLMSNGLTSLSLVVPMLLVVAAFVYPPPVSSRCRAGIGMQGPSPQAPPQQEGSPPPDPLQGRPVERAHAAHAPGRRLRVDGL